MDALSFDRIRGGPLDSIEKNSVLGNIGGGGADGVTGRRCRDICPESSYAPINHDLKISENGADTL